MENIRIISRNKDLPKIIRNLLRSNFGVSAKDFYKNNINFRMTNPVPETADSLNVSLLIIGPASLDIKKEIILNYYLTDLKIVILNLRVSLSARIFL